MKLHRKTQNRLSAQVVAQQSPGAREDRGFDFDTSGVYVRSFSYTGVYIVHDSRCPLRSKERCEAVPDTDIGEPFAAEPRRGRRRAQICCTYCRRKGWLWDWAKPLEDGW